MISIDKSAGFCWGVVKTIEKVEQILLANPSKNVYVLGDIIHNPHEIKRLNSIKLNTINLEDINNISPQNAIIMIRAHGEPPATYTKIAKLGIELVDTTCPLVKRLQNKILKYYQNNRQIVIFGKNNHAEVIGLRGCCNDKCKVCLCLEDIIDKIDYNKPTVLLSQTTMNVNEFVLLSEKLQDAFKSTYINADTGNNLLQIENTVCKFMISREAKLKQFAQQNDLILFVAGHNSSNGKVLFDICKSENTNTIFIEDIDEITNENLNSILVRYPNIGITGATSTPMWFMEEIANKLDEAKQQINITH